MYDTKSTKHNTFLPLCTVFNPFFDLPPPKKNQKDQRNYDKYLYNA